MVGMIGVVGDGYNNKDFNKQWVWWVQQIQWDGRCPVALSRCSLSGDTDCAHEGWRRAAIAGWALATMIH